nr:Protein Y48B6A.5 [Haemonchus contortus]
MPSIASPSAYEQLRVDDEVDNRLLPLLKKDVIKLITCSMLILQCIDMSKGRILKSSTSIPALYFSYKLSLQEDNEPVRFHSITTPLILYCMLESVATFATLDLADVILYVALKICLLEMLRWKMKEHGIWDFGGKVSNQLKTSTSEDIIMDVTQTYPTQDDRTYYRTVRETTLSSAPMDLAQTPLSPWPVLRRATPVSAKQTEPASKSTQPSAAVPTEKEVHAVSQVQPAYGDWHDIESTKKLSQTRSLPTVSMRTVKSTVSTSSIYEPAHGGAHLVTNPMLTIEFPRFGHKRWKRVTVSNVSQQNIIWSLRTNMGDNLFARPTAGVLKAGQHGYVKVYITDTCDLNGKVVFSYGFVDKSVEKFERKLYLNSERISHTLNVLFH